MSYFLRLLQVFSLFILILGPPSLSTVYATSNQSYSQNSTSLISSDVLTLPEELKDWSSWVQYDPKKNPCPFIYNQSSQTVCQWISPLSLTLVDDLIAKKTVGRFIGTWQFARASLAQPVFLLLPGDMDNWPQSVMLNNEPAIVIQRKGHPVIEIQKPGDYFVSGEFRWRHAPDRLKMPRNLSLVSLIRTNAQGVLKKPALFSLSGDYLLLDNRIQKAETKAAAPIQNTLDIQVYRKLTDSIPFTVETKLVLNVSGYPREVKITNPVLTDFLVNDISANVPVRIDAQNNVFAQVKAGTTIINLSSYHSKRVEIMYLREMEAPLPKEEIWVIEKQPNLRIIDIKNIDPVDLSQTNTPSQWKQFSGYLMQADSTMLFDVLQEGNQSREQDQLSLKRTVWLDFDGQGMSIQDAISGKMTQSWRLNADNNLKLSQAILNNKPHLITEKNNQQGIQLNKGNLNLVVNSRYQHTANNESLNLGWQHDFNKVTLNLNVPPGWTLAAVTGVDSSNSWLSKWNLWDIFFVLILSVSVGRLAGIQWGVIACLTFFLTWYHVESPKALWVFLIVNGALLTVLPVNRFQRIIRNTQNMSLAILALMLIQFSFHQVRTGLYPQLDTSHRFSMANNKQDTAMLMGASHQIAKSSMESVDTLRDSGMRSPVAEYKQYKQLAKKAQSNRVRKKENLKQTDPNAAVQTGFGLPQWSHKHYRLSWNGEVGTEVNSHFYFITPLMQFMINLLEIFLMFALAFCLARLKKGPTLPEPSSGQATPTSALMVSAVFIGLLLTQGFSPVMAATSTIPDAATLNTLNEKLTLQKRHQLMPACLPLCGQISKGVLNLSKDQLTLSFELHVSAPVAIPLPQSSDWVPADVRLNKTPVRFFYRDAQQQLWVHVEPGRHRLSLSGNVSDKERIAISLPIKPHRLITQLDKAHWSLSGMVNDKPNRTLTLKRIQKVISPLSSDKNPQFSQKSVLQGTAIIERRLSLGIDWRITTTVRKTSKAGQSSFTKSIPLLEGEQVLTTGVQIEKKDKVTYAQINLDAKQSSVTWQSQIKPVSALSLIAGQHKDYHEVWYLDFSPIWSVDMNGIPTSNSQSGQWSPEWHPYPGERIDLSISRPKAIEGKTFTIIQSHLDVLASQYANTYTLTLSARSSKGGRYTIDLPASVDIQSIQHNNRNQMTKKTKSETKTEVTLPVNPSSNHYEIKWIEKTNIFNEGFAWQPSPLNLHTESANHSVSIKLNTKERWLLWAKGPVMGPAVLFWGNFLAFMLFALALGRYQSITTLSTTQWLILLAGLSQIHAAGLFILVAWFVCFNRRKPFSDRLMQRPILFNMTQIGLAGLTLIALSVLLYSMHQGLLGSPEMQIAGNHSYGGHLKWYQDRVGEQLSDITLYTVPLYVYRVVMMLWAMWLAWSLIDWLKINWILYAYNGLWKTVKKPKSTLKSPEN